MSATDAILLERWQTRRDADAFTELVRRHSAMVVSCCRRILGDPALAEDVAQECFIALMQSRDAVRASLGAWLHTIAVHRSIDRIKSDARRRKREVVFAESQTAETTPDVAVDEILACVDEAIAELPDEYRAAVVGRILQNQTHTSLAQEFGVVEGTIRYRVDQGVDRIRQALRRRGIAVSAAGLAVAMNRTVEAAPAELIVRLGKLALSGSVAAPVAAGVSVGWIITALAAALVALTIGGVAWYGKGETPSVDSIARPEAAIVQQNGVDGMPSRTEASVAAPAVESNTLNAASIAGAGSTPEHGPSSVRGRIYDATTGEGIAGVRAYMYPAGGGAHMGRSEPTGADGRYSLPPLDDGTYSVSLEDIEKYPNPRGKHSVSVTLKNGEPATVDFELEPGVPVSGMVIAENGQPVAGAEVVAAIHSTPNPNRTESNDEGKFTLYMPEASDSLRVQAQNEGAESSVEGAFPLTEEGIEGVMLMLDRPKTASIRGIVVDASGKPMAGAQLHPVRKGADIFRYGRFAVAGSDGRFQITGLASAEYGVVVTPKGVSGFSTAEEYLRVHPGPGEALEGIAIVYGEKGGMAIAGRVVDSSGQPIERARVACYMERGMETAYTDAAGGFTITGLDDTLYSLSVDHDSYSRGSGQFTAGTTDAEIVLKRRGIFAGRVLRGDTGEPLTAYTLAYLMGEARAFDEMLFGSGRPIESADGSFSMGEVQAGRITVAAWAPGFAPELRYVDVDEDEAANAEFRLAAVPPFEGTVVDEAGEPVANAAVYFVTGVTIDRMDRAAAARSDARGRFVVESLPPDAKRLCAYRPGYGAGVVNLPSEGRIVLPAQAMVKGAIVEDDDELDSFAVNAYYSDDRHLPSVYVQPGPDGIFTIAGLSPGLLTVSIMPNGLRHYASRTFLIESGERLEFDFVFERGTASVEGQLLSEGEPVTHASINLERHTGDAKETLRATPDATGAFRFDRVWAGNLVLLVTQYDPDDPHEPVVHELGLVVSDGQMLRQDVALPPLP